MFYLALDEVEKLEQTMHLFSSSILAPYRFEPADHLPEPKLPAADDGISTLKTELKSAPNNLKIEPKSDQKVRTLERRIINYAKSHGISEKIERITVLTNVRVLGYVFNPVSFFFCFDKSDRAICCIPEVGNTFGEKKAYLLKANAQGKFIDTQIKHFYVSPFTELEELFRFDLQVPGNELNIRIDTVTPSQDGALLTGYKQESQPVLSALVTGESLTLTDMNLAWLTVRFPFSTLAVITFIHWHAFLLWLKKVPFHMKEQEANLQKDVLNPHISLKIRSLK